VLNKIYQSAHAGQIILDSGPHGNHVNFIQRNFADVAAEVAIHVTHHFVTLNHLSRCKIVRAQL
jgi:hypothetical protein